MAIACRVLQKGKCEISNPYYAGHSAVDLVGENYTLDYVVAHSDGTVIEVLKSSNENTSGQTKYGSIRVARTYGNYVKIKHTNGMYSLYAHLKYGSVTVNVGDKVTEGQVIGYMGNTGYSFGAHLHFEVRDTNDNIVNPTKYINSRIVNDTESFITGNYKCNYDMKVRTGPRIRIFCKKSKRFNSRWKKECYKYQFICICSL